MKLEEIRCNCVVVSDDWQQHAESCPFRMMHKIDKLEDTLEKIKDWCEAYPVSIFPEPDFKKAASVLKDNGMTIDSISASAMRHVVSGIKKLIPRD